MNLGVVFLIVSIIFASMVIEYIANNNQTSFTALCVTIALLFLILLGYIAIHNKENKSFEEETIKQTEIQEETEPQEEVEPQEESPILAQEPFVYAEVCQNDGTYTIFEGTNGKYYTCEGHWEYDTPYLLDVFADDVYGVWVIDNGGVEE